jgi:hypothetical protein
MRPSSRAIRPELESDQVRDPFKAQNDALPQDAPEDG